MSDNIKAESETLLDIAERNLSAGKTLKKEYPNDDGMPNLIGYHCQQAIELALKHILETHTVKYPRTHDIVDLLELIPSDYPNILNDVDKYANKISNLESNTRYIKGYRAKVEIVDKIYEIASSLIDNIRNIERREMILITNEEKKYSVNKQNQR